METSFVISVVAGVAQLIGYFLYNRAIFSKDIVPNSSSWFLWSVGSSIATVSYCTISEDWVKNILPLTCSVACVGTFIFSLCTGNFSRPDKWDILVIILDVLVVIFWMTTEMENVANLLLQIDIALSFWPMIRETYHHPENERKAPWIVWDFAYLFMLIVVLMRYEKWWDLLYPINLFFLCLLVTALICRGKKTTCE